MAYRPINKLRLVYIIQEYTKQKQALGITNKRIHANISQIYPISIDRFYKYLAINAKAILRADNVNFEELNKQKDYIISIIPD